MKPLYFLPVSHTTPLTFLLETTMEFCIFGIGTTAALIKIIQHHAAKNLNFQWMMLTI